MPRRWMMWVGCGVMVVAGAYWLWSSGNKNFLGYGLMLLCPLMHLFMHGGHGQHDHGSHEQQAASQGGGAQEAQRPETQKPGPYEPGPGEKLVVFKGLGMHCSGCQASIEAELQDVAGTHHIDVSLRSQTATVLFDPSKTTADTLRAAIRRAGYKPQTEMVVEG